MATVRGAVTCPYCRKPLPEELGEQGGVPDSLWRHQRPSPSRREADPAFSTPSGMQAYACGCATPSRSSSLSARHAGVRSPRLPRRSAAVPWTPRSGGATRSGCECLHGLAALATTGIGTACQREAPRDSAGGARLRPLCLTGGSAGAPSAVEWGRCRPPRGCAAASSCSAAYAAAY
jgi:hypothetical protein